jgi:hypothetical protein
MTKEDYIKIYNEKLARIRSECQKEYKIDNEFVYYFGITDYQDSTRIWYKYPIEKCLKIMDIFREAIKYLYSLNVGDKITEFSYGSEDRDAVITKINYGRDLRRDGSKRISSFIIKSFYERKIKPTDVCYGGSRIYDIQDSFRMFNPKGFLFFGQYNIKDAEEIIEKYEKQVLKEGE